MTKRETEKGILRNPYATECSTSLEDPSSRKFYESWYPVPALDTPVQRHEYSIQHDGMGRHFASAVLETLADNRDNFRQPLMIADAADRLAMNSDDERWRTSLVRGMDMPIDAGAARIILREVSASGHYGGWPSEGMVYRQFEVGGVDTSHGRRYAALPVEPLGAAIAKLSRPEWVPGLAQRLEDLESAKRQDRAARAVRDIARASFGNIRITDQLRWAGCEL